MTPSPISRASSCAANGSSFSASAASDSAATPDRNAWSQASPGNRVNWPAGTLNTGCSAALLTSERMPCVPSTATARSRLSTGWSETR